MMAYSSKFVLCVLLDNVPQKEFDDGAVVLPANCEYALRFRNKNDRRAVVKFFIDGEEVSGPGYIIEANDHTDIKRHFHKAVNFRFVSNESGDAVEFGKNGPDPERKMGVVEARFFLEKEQPKVIEKHIHHHHDYRPRPWVNPYPYYGGLMRSRSSDGDKTLTCGLAGAEAIYSSADSAPNVANYSSGSIPVLSTGCTVEGSVSDQRFTTGYCETETTYTTLKVVLKVNNSVEPVQKKPIKLKKHAVTELELENEKLKQQIAELENEKLKKQLADLKA